MAARLTDDRPPKGFAVLRESDIDPDQGRSDRWVCRGIINGRSIIRSGLTSRTAACRASWSIFNDALAASIDFGFSDAAEAEVARALARRHDLEVADAAMPEAYIVDMASWSHMTADLLSQIITDAGSIRRAATVLDVPKSTLGRWVRLHKERGTWPS